MQPEQINWDGMGNQWKYVCPSCDHTRIIEPIGRNAANLTVSVLALTFLAVLNYMDRTSDWISWTIWGGVCLLFLGFPAFKFFIHSRYPVTGTVETEVQKDILEDPLQQGLEKIEKVSFLRGLLSPIFMIIIVLGLALLYGIFIDS